MGRERRNEGFNRARIQTENIKKRQMDSLIEDIQAYALIQGKHLAKRLTELSIMLKNESANSEYVANELQDISINLMKLAK